MVKKILILTLYAVLLAQMSSCQNRKYMKDPKFELYTYWEADENYPMELVYGCFYCPGGKNGNPIRSGYSIGPWGAGGHMSSSHKEQLLPDKLELKWYSFVEDKSYWGSFDLPYDRLLEIFQKTYIRHRLKDYWHYDGLAVGLAPGGQVYLWVNGLFGEQGGQVFVAKFQAEETHINQKTLTGTSHPEYERWPEERWPEIMEKYRREIFCGKIEDNYNAKGLQLGLWDSYNERFNWRPVMVYEDSTAGWETDEIYMQFFNGELEVLALDPLRQNVFKDRARIRDIDCYYTNWKEFMNVVITFDEDELFDAFAKIFGDNLEKEVQLEIRLNEANDFFRVFIVSLDPADHRKTVELRRAHIKRYGSTTNQTYIRRFYQNR